MQTFLLIPVEKDKASHLDQSYCVDLSLLNNVYTQVQHQTPKRNCNFHFSQKEIGLPFARVLVILFTKAFNLLV